MKHIDNIIEIIKALEYYEVDKIEISDNTIYIDFNTPELAEDVYYYLIYNHEDLLVYSDYDKSRNDVRIRLTLK